MRHNRYFNFTSSMRPQNAQIGDIITLELVENYSRKELTLETTVGYREDFPCSTQLKGRIMMDGHHYNIEINLNQNHPQKDFVVLIET